MIDDISQRQLHTASVAEEGLLGGRGPLLLHLGHSCSLWPRLHDELWCWQLLRLCGQG